MNNFLSVVDTALAVQQAESPKDLANLGLPKWPQMLTVGSNVTIEQAKEIIRRTDRYFPSPEFASNDRDYNLRVAHQLGLPVEGDSRDIQASIAIWNKREEWLKDWQYIQTQYVHNSWIATSFIGGPHGWCNPDGSILFADNIGKWPSVSDVLEDWTTLASAFPFVNLIAILMSGEGCEDHSSPVVGFRVNNGSVSLFDPSKLTVPKVERDLDACLHLAMSGDSRSEQGIEWEWIEEWGRRNSPSVRHLTASSLF